MDAFHPEHFEKGDEILQLLQPVTASSIHPDSSSFCDFSDSSIGMLLLKADIPKDDK